MANLQSYMKLIRPLNCSMGSLGVFIAALIGAGVSVFDYLLDVIIALIVVFIFMAGANALNDYYDRNTDKVNHPERPIPSGKIKPTSALKYGTTALLLSFVISIFINLTSFLIVCISAILILFYELHFKNRGFIGNLTISLLVAFLFIFGGSVVQSYNLNIILAVMAFFATMSREIVKDIQDIAGDINRLTLPKSIGIKSAGLAAAICLIIAVLISPVPYVDNIIPITNIDYDVGTQYLGIVIIADIIFLNSVKEIGHNPKKASNLLKLGMMVALMAFLAGALF